MVINFNEEELKQWKKVKDFLELYLKRDVTNDLVPNTVLEALEKLTEDLLEKTKMANCNCISSHNNYLELKEEAKELEKLMELMK